MAQSPAAVNVAPRRARASRKSALERREEILVAAVDFFAEHGFAGSTHVLAAGIGVRQALLYRYFESKDALVEAVFARVAGARWTHDLPAILGDRSRPLDDRLRRENVLNSQRRAHVVFLELPIRWNVTRLRIGDGLCHR